MGYVIRIVFAGLLTGGVAFTATALATDRLTIGSKAPPIDVECWLTDLPPVVDFQRDKVYVIELWATSCGPCVASLPHLRDLQLQHDRDVVIVSISNESPERIEEFLNNARDGTLKEIAGHYRLASDPDGSVSKDYMQAAGQQGIPTTFIIGKTVEIESAHPAGLGDASTVVPSPSKFGEAKRNGVQSRGWGPFSAAFFMQPSRKNSPKQFMAGIPQPTCMIV